MTIIFEILKDAGLMLVITSAICTARYNRKNLIVYFLFIMILLFL